MTREVPIHRADVRSQAQAMVASLDRVLPGRREELTILDETRLLLVELVLNYTM